MNRTPMLRRMRAVLSLLALTVAPGWPGVANAQDAGRLALETLDLSKVTQGYGDAHARRSVNDNPLTIKGTVYLTGLGTHADSSFLIDLKGAATAFESWVGVDDETGGKGSVVFEIYVDGKKVADSGLMHGGDAPKRLTAPLTGAKRLTLKVTDGGDGVSYDHADWAGAFLTLADGVAAKPEAATVPVVPPRMTVPPLDPKPAIHGPRITGATPGRPFLFLIPATGTPPLTFAAKNLPAGITLDKTTGILSGALLKNGSTDAQIMVRNAQGRASRKLTIVGGVRQLSLTPPMGWNSWNCWAGAVDDAKTRQSTDAMLASGLAAHGFQYINIDDTWEAQRDAKGEILTNAKFPDMKALSDYVHGKGLKIGIYSSPGPKTCGGYEASYQHEEQDALTYAKWGMDYLKYDWCSYSDIAKNPDLDAMKQPYRVMRAALDKTSRDIVFSLCQYGMGDVWQWGPEVGGNCWRTTGDINDSWGSLYGIYSAQDGHEKLAGPGHWNDPDMLIVGRVGWGNPHPSRLTPNEQILHISMWCLLASPLLIGCDMAQLDPFTIALLSNDEALDINQDTLGQPAGRRAKSGEGEVWARPLADGTTAVGLLNNGVEEEDVTANWSDLGLRGRQPVRDLWLHKDVGAFADKYTVRVPAHGAILLKIGKGKAL